jgi:nucleotide-binding universal stress UspA family protein
MDRRSIIAAIDGSPEATNAARAAAALARTLGRRLVLASVAEDPAVFPYGDPRERELQRRRVTDEANEILVSAIADVGAPTRKRIVLSGPVQGSVAERLNSLVREEDADVIVLGSSARGPLRRLFGSVTAELRGISDAPVLVVPRDTTAVTWEPGGTIVVGVDGTAGSARAQVVASGLAERLGMTVVPTFIDQALGSWEEAPGIRVELGDPAWTLGESATANHAELVVVGTRGETFGSVSQQLAALSAVPVMIVPPHAELPDLRPSERRAAA